MTLLSVSLAIDSSAEDEHHETQKSLSLCILGSFLCQP